ncbi:MAG: D-aminoacyl-tRNA deacylase [Candidatus Promineifilaceae bacterium]
MRVLLQRVTSSSVTVAGEIVGEIAKGFTLLVGITHSDTQAEANWLANKIAGIRLFEDDAGKMNLALADVGGSVLAISQFTLYGDARKGRRPSFINASRPEHAEPLFDYFVAKLRSLGLQVETGRFGASMAVDIQNDGPVTLMLERDAA